MPFIVTNLWCLLFRGKRRSSRTTRYCLYVVFLFTHHLDETDLVSVLFSVPPSVSVAKSKMSVFEKDNVDLSCQANAGVPPPSIKWHRKNDELPLSSRLQYLSPTKMRIKDVRLSDAGVFVCRALNSEGIAEENFTLVVKSKCFAFFSFTHCLTTSLCGRSYPTIHYQTV